MNVRADVGFAEITVTLVRPHLRFMLIQKIVSAILPSHLRKSISDKYSCQTWVRQVGLYTHATVSRMYVRAEVEFAELADGSTRPN